jgi:hypothetical protein
MQGERITGYVCEGCGAITAGDALCGACLSRLEQAAHPPFPREASAVELRDSAVCIADAIRFRLRQHLDARPACAVCVMRPEIRAAVADAEHAAADIASSLDVLARMACDARFAIDASALRLLAAASRRVHAALESIAVRIGTLDHAPLTEVSP